MDVSETEQINLFRQYTDDVADCIDTLSENYLRKNVDRSFLLNKRNPNIHKTKNI